MTTHIKKAFLTGLFFFGLLTGSKAQDKNDFALVYLNYNKQPVAIHIIQNDQAVKVIETGKKPGDFDGLMERLLSTISQLTEDGWEVINVSIANNGTSLFYLKRKKKE